MTGNRVVLGLGLALLSALSFSGTTISTVIAFEGGASPLSAVTVRFPGAIVVLVVLMRLTAARLALPPRQRWFAFGIGLLLAVQSFTLLTSFAHIPAGLTMIIFYVYPLLVGVVAGLSGEERMSAALKIGLVVAFAGLVLVFNVTGEGLNTAGVIWAVLAALSWTAVIVFSARVIGGGDSLPVTLHIQLSAAVAAIAACLISGEATLPVTASGWTAYLAMPVFYAIASTAFFAAVAAAGPVRPSLVMNVEPVVTIVLGYFILDQVLSGMQLVGATLVVAAVAAVRWQGRVAAAEG